MNKWLRMSWPYFAIIALFLCMIALKQYDHITPREKEQIRVQLERIEDTRVVTKDKH